MHSFLGYISAMVLIGNGACFVVMGVRVIMEVLK